MLNKLKDYYSNLVDKKDKSKHEKKIVDIYQSLSRYSTMRVNHMDEGEKVVSYLKDLLDLEKNTEVQSLLSYQIALMCYCLHSRAVSKKYTGTFENSDVYYIENALKYLSCEQHFRLPMYHRVANTIRIFLSQCIRDMVNNVDPKKLDINELEKLADEHYNMTYADISKYKKPYIDCHVIAEFYRNNLNSIPNAGEKLTQWAKRAVTLESNEITQRFMVMSYLDRANHEARQSDKCHFLEKAIEKCYQVKPGERWDNYKKTLYFLHMSLDQNYDKLSYEVNLEDKPAYRERALVNQLRLYRSQIFDTNDNDNDKEILLNSYRSWIVAAIDYVDHEKITARINEAREICDTIVDKQIRQRAEFYLADSEFTNHYGHLKTNGYLSDVSRSDEDKLRQYHSNLCKRFKLYNKEYGVDARMNEVYQTSCHNMGTFYTSFANEKFQERVQLEEKYATTVQDEVSLLEHAKYYYELEGNKRKIRELETKILVNQNNTEKFVKSCTNMVATLNSITNQTDPRVFKEWKLKNEAMASVQKLKVFSASTKRIEEGLSATSSKSTSVERQKANDNDKPKSKKRSLSIFSDPTQLPDSDKKRRKHRVRRRKKTDKSSLSK